MTPYYQDDAVTIYHGDAREILPTLDKVDAVVTDPPYGVGLGTRPRADKMSKHGGGYSQIDDTRDYVRDVVVPIITKCRLVSGRVVLTPGLANLWLYPEPDALWGFYWSNGAGVGRWRAFTCWQPILCYGKGPADRGCYPDTFAQKASAEKNGHPCPKPLDAWERLMRRASKEGETILDPFMGSGTTLVAAKRLGRRAIGIELSEEYCEIAARRCGDMSRVDADDEPLLAMMQEGGEPCE